jgi:uracil-DNA glycosylase
MNQISPAHSPLKCYPVDDWEVPDYPSTEELAADRDFNDDPYDLGEIEDGNQGWRMDLSGLGGALHLSSVYVPGEGNHRDPLAMVIGEAPGAQEEIKRRPFVGPSGAVQRDLMALAGLWANDGHVTLSGGEKWPASSNCWLTNAVHFRPPLRNGSRAPLPIEIKAAREWLRHEWVTVGKPRLIVPIGGVALEAILGKRVSILRAAGKCHWIKSREGLRMAIWPMVHPAFGLRNPAVQPLLEQDWEKLGDCRHLNEPIGR